MIEALAWAAGGLFVLSLGYVGFAIERVLRFRQQLNRAPRGRIATPVTLLKPLCGPELELLENLRSFCRQDYGIYQIVFGVRDPADPAIGVVETLRTEFPERDIALVVDARIVGANFKVSNLANMMCVAKHDILIVSDSDMRVAPNYIAAIVAPFERAEVGATTCLYSGTARRGTASKLGAMFINDWFFPSALIPLSFGELKFCFGATMAIRRDVLDAIGGFPAMADHIADDYALGRLTADAGYKIAVAAYVIENIVDEPSVRSLFHHEIRWARTIRSVQPLGYGLSFVTELLPLSLLAGLTLFLATASAWLLVAPVAIALILRYALHRVVAASQPSGGTFAPWLIPVRDLFSLAVRVTSFFGSTVQWREQVMTVEPYGPPRKSLRDAAGSQESAVVKHAD